MRVIDSATDAKISKLIASRQSGFGLPRPFYVDEDVFAADLAAVWRRGWLFAGHRAEVPQPGDYFTFEVDGDSIILLHDDDGEIRALYNTCRHRGSLICTQPSGHVGKLVCPYHQWVYDRDGSLLGCGGARCEFDKREYGLNHAQVREVSGLIFVSLSDDPEDFGPPQQAIAQQADPHGLDRAKVAHTIDYTVRANWKLVFENNRECFHCTANHLEFCAATYDVERDQGKLEEISAAVRGRLAHWPKVGEQETASVISSKMSGKWYRANRAPLKEGFVTESLDGRPVSTLMGSLTHPDVGTCRMTTFPNFWCHASCDHAVSTRLLPVDATTTQIRVYWLVDAAAEEGRDYELDRVLPFWQRTSEQDWVICENNQAGVQSSRYRPGPYTPDRETNVEQFVEWYLEQFGAT